MLNKKAIFIPTLVVLTLVVLTSLAITMLNTNKSRNDAVIGQSSIEMLKCYGEAEKAMLYLEMASKYAKNNTLKALNNNIGYSSCKIDLLGDKGYAIINSCTGTDINKNFEEQFKKELKEYTSLYESSYSISKNQQGILEYFVGSEETEANYKDYYSTIINNLKDPSLNTENNNLKVEFGEIKFPVEGNQLKRSIYYSFKPVFSLDYPDLSAYKDIFSTYTSCSNNENIKEECSKRFKDNFNADITENNKQLLVKISEPYELEFVISI